MPEALLTTVLAILAVRPVFEPNMLKLMDV